jgi:hypothetical protein
MSQQRYQGRIANAEARDGDRKDEYQIHNGADPAQIHRGRGDAQCTRKTDEGPNTQGIANNA